jgi:competence ComEA-like helix-hairpin-helix protein
LHLFVLTAILSGACTLRKSAQNSAATIARNGSSRLVNINTADAATLELIPGIGPALAGKIIEHRTRYGAFRRIENLMLIEGVSDRRFREIRHLITVE